MSQVDSNQDGKLSYDEFKKSLDGKIAVNEQTIIKEKMVHEPHKVNKCQKLNNENINCQQHYYV